MSVSRRQQRVPTDSRPSRSRYGWTGPRTTAVVFAATLFLVALVTSCSSGDEVSTGAGTTVAQQSSLTGLVRESPLKVGDVTLPDVTVGSENGTFTFRARPGELLIAYFGYTTCPDVCPTTLAFLRTARGELGADGSKLDLAMVTVDPNRDTPEKLSAYLGSFAERYHAIRTTDPAELKAAEDAFTAQSQVTVQPDGRVEVSHSGTTYVVDDRGTVLIEWPFGTTADEMAHDLRILIARGQASGS